MAKQKRALILSGWYQKPDTNWYPWLKSELENESYKVVVPDLPTIHTDLPDLKQMLSFVDQLHAVDESTLIVGHSLGCLLAMRIAERQKYHEMILVSGWDFNDLTAEHQLFWRSPIDHDKIKQNVKEIYCISSDNDPYITAFQAEEMSKRLGGKFILTKGAGHFLSKTGTTQISELRNCVNN